MTHENDLADFTRRGFIKTIVMTAATTLLLPATANADTPATPDTKINWIDIGALSQFSKDWTRVVLPADYNQEVIYVREHSDKPLVFQALSSRCTHRGCTVAWQADQTEFQCPCHGAVFNSDGTNIRGTRRKPDEHLPNLAALQTQVSPKNTLLVEAPKPTSSSDD